MTTTRIAATAGVSVGTVYQYFPSKEALVAAWEERVWSRLFTEVQTLYADLVARGEVFERMVYELVHLAASEVDRIANTYKTMPGEGMLSARAEQKMEMAEQTSLFVGAALSAFSQHLRIANADLSARLLMTLVVNTAFYGATEQPQYARTGAWAHELADVVCMYLLKHPELARTPRGVATP